MGRALNMSSLGTQGRNKALGRATLGRIDLIEAAWNEVVKFVLYVKRLFKVNLER